MIRTQAPKVFLGFIFATILGLFSPTSVGAAEKLSPEAVKSLTLEAAVLIGEKGLEAARPTFYTEGKFKQGEIYVNVINGAGTWLVYPPRPAGEGQSVINVKDADGKFLVKDIIDVAEKSGEGWVEYRWLNPASNKIEPKLTFVKKIPSQDLITYIGIYK
jgi:cytochrome c